MSITTLPLYNRQILSVDSRSRVEYGQKDPVTGAFITSPNAYTVRFPQIRNVKMVNLVTSEIPNTMYVINSTNNVITFDSDVAPATAGLTATLTEGTYSAAELANEINLQMNTAMGAGFGALLVATYITWTKKITITRTDGNNIRIYWTAPLSPRFEIGFDDIDMPALAATVTSDNTVNLSGENFIYLVIKEFQAAVRGTENLDRTFAKIIFNTPPHSYTFDSFAANPLIFNVPINTVNKLEIEFRRHDGTLYDFQYAEHSFSLEFYTTL